MTDATVTSIGPAKSGVPFMDTRSTTAAKVLEIVFTTAGTYALPAGTTIAGIIAGKNGGNVTGVALSKSIYTLTLALGASGVPNSVFILQE